MEDKRTAEEDLLPHPVTRELVTFEEYADAILDVVVKSLNTPSKDEKED